MTDDTNIRHLPEPGVVLDLDLEERPKEDIKPPFVARIGDKNVTLADPSEIDWHDLAGVNHPADLLHIAMSREDRQHLHKQEMPAWKFNRLMEAYYNHYDLEEKIRTAKRQAQFGA